MKSAPKPYLEQVKGNTWCLVTGYVRMPLYRITRERALLIDSGLAVYRQDMLDLLRREGIKIEAILTSHAHIDHTGNHRTFQQAHGAQLYMAPFHAAVSSSQLNLKSYLGSSYRGTLSYGSSMLCRADHLFDPTAPSLTAGEVTFGLIPLLGHVPEHIGFVTPDGVAYLADLLMSNHVLDSVHIPYCTCCELDLQAKQDSSKLNYSHFILAHNGVCTDIAPLARRNYDNLLEKIELVESLADHYITLEELTAKAAAAMGMEGDTLYKIQVARQNIRAYVEYLTDLCRLAERADHGIIQYIRADCL